MAGFEITKVTKEFIAVEKDPDGTATFGDILNVHLTEIALKGGIVQSVALQMEEAEWLEFAAGIRKANYGVDALPSKTTR